MPKETKKYEDDGWSPITVKASIKKQLAEFKLTTESWTEAIQRLLKIAEDEK